MLRLSAGAGRRRAGSGCEARPLQKGVVEKVLKIDSLHGVAPEKRVRHPPALRRQRRRDGQGQPRLSLANGLQKGQVGGAGVGWRPHQALVQNTPYTPQVCLGVVLLAGQDLGSHVER